MDNHAMAELVDGHTLVFVREVPHSPERVWKAISDQSELMAWMRYPVSFRAEVGETISFFGEPDGIIGQVFIADPPRTLAFSFWDANKPETAAKVGIEWTVRWDLDPIDGGCRITFQHRHLGGAHLWGLGEGWHGFLEQLLAYLDGQLEKLLAKRPAAGTDDDTATLTAYRAHISRQLRAWADEAAAIARATTSAGDRDAAFAAIDQLELSTKQFYEIARQDGPRPDYAPARG
jgi:uncharacterized protein YndB with AHSA1/START domain